ncbi:MAG: hypothetical protein ACLFVQ_08605 [Chitinispirillaceae bacterium]
MKRLPGLVLTFCLVLYATLFSQSYTYGLVQEISYNYDHERSTYVYDTVYVSRQLSQTKLNSVSLEVEPRGSYLDVTENAVISPSLSSDGSSQPPFYIKGSICLPEGSSIVSFSVSSDTNLYSAKVLPEFPRDYEVDTTLGDDLASLKRLNNHGNRYQLRLNSVEPGREYKIQLRYLVPNRGKAAPSYSLSILNHSFDNPGFFELKYSAASKTVPYKLEIAEKSYPFTDGMAIQVPYQQYFEIKSTDSADSKMHTTIFEDGPWAGKYLIFNTSVPDTVIASMSKSIETVFLWRWNRPSSFVIKDRHSDYSFITGYGRQAVSQASSIREMVQYLTQTGNKTGMVHSIQYKEPEVFPLCDNKGSAFAKLDGYLSQFTEDYFQNSGYFEYDTRPDDPIPTGPVDSSKAEFKRSLKLVHGLYSNGNGILKHLVIVCAGPVQISRDMITIEEIDTLVGDLTVDCENAVWRDVSFNLVKTISLESDLVRMGNFSFPEFRPSSMILQVGSETKDYSFPIAPDQASFSIVAKSEGAWNPEMTWMGFNSSGDPVGTVKTDASHFGVEGDTGLVKIWASSADRLSETEETEIGLKYGVISESSSLRIFSSFKGYDSTTSAYASASPVYWEKTTGSSASDLSSKARITKFKCTFLNGLLRISLPGDEKVQRIRIFSLAGRLLADFDPADYRTVEGYVIPRSCLKGIAGNGMVVVRVVGEKWVRSQNVVLGR